MRVAVLVSGTGTNLQALIDADVAPATIAVVVSNRPGVMALDRASRAGIPAVVVDHAAFPDRAAFEDALHAALVAHDVEAIVLAGFMRVLTSGFVDRYPRRIVNTHPSLLPAFPGAHAARDAIAHAVKLAGATIHFVDATLDGGPIIAQRAVPVSPDDDEASLQRKIQAVEHHLLPRVVRLLAQGRLVCKGRRVVVVSSDGDTADADQLV
jgi:phosphoribosylglycinamide formyltransferase-1